MVYEEDAQNNPKKKASLGLASRTRFVIMDKSLSITIGLINGDGRFNCGGDKP